MAHASGLGNRDTAWLIVDVGAVVMRGRRACGSRVVLQWTATTLTLTTGFNFAFLVRCRCCGMGRL